MRFRKSKQVTIDMEGIEGEVDLVEVEGLEEARVTCWEITIRIYIRCLSAFFFPCNCFLVGFGCWV